MKTLFTFLLALCFFNAGFSQGFLGYNRTLTGGIGVSYSGQTFDGDIIVDWNSNNYFSSVKEGMVIADFDDPLFLPRLNLQYGINLSSHVQLNLSAGFRPLRKSTLEIISSGIENGQEVIYRDEFQVKSNAIDLSGDFRFYRAFSPVGGYLSLGLGTSLLRNNIQASYNTYVNYALDKTSTDSESSLRPFPYFWVGYGNTHILKRRCLIDYGAKLNVYLFPSVFRRSSSPYQTKSYVPGRTTDLYFDDLLRDSNVLNLQHYNLLEFYVRFGIAWGKGK